MLVAHAPQEKPAMPTPASFAEFIERVRAGDQDAAAGGSTNQPSAGCPLPPGGRTPGGGPAAEVPALNRVTRELGLDEVWDA